MMMGFVVVFNRFRCKFDFNEHWSDTSEKPMETSRVRQGNPDKFITSRRYNFLSMCTG